MSINTSRYDLDTDITLGGDNPSDQAAVSQKAIKYYIDHSSGGIVIDDELSTTSENPVQNKVIAQAIENISLAKNPNLNLIGGSLNIDSGNVSGFSTTDYMQFPFVFNFNGYTWTLEMDFTTGLNVTTQQNILDSYYGIAFAINNGKFLMALSSNGSSWDIGSTSGAYSVQANTAYSVKIAWDGTKYTLSYALDETNYTTDITISSSAVHHSTQEYVGSEPELFGSGSQHPFNGTINLNNWKLTVNGLEVWLGMDDVGLGSRANIDLSNLTEAGLAKFQTPLVSGENIKTINGESILGNGNITIQSGGTVDQVYDPTSSNAQSGIAIAGANFLTSADLPTNYVTTDTVQDISGRKTFLGEKAIYFKQQATSNKLGFTLYNPSNTELAALEYRPNTISGASLLALNCPQTTGGYVGFRYWGTPAVNIVAPKVATAGNYFMATHITDGTNTVTANNTGAVNISTLLPDVSNYVTNTSLATTLADYVTNSALTTTLADYALSADIPTKTSDLTNDSDFATVSQIPTNNNQLTNGAGYITNSALNGYATEAYVDTGLTTKQDVLTEGSGISIVAAGSTQTLPLAQTLPLEIINNTVQIYNNIDTSNALTVVIEVPYGANMAITPRIDDYYCIGVHNDGSGLYFYDTHNIGQSEYNSILIPTSGTNAYYVKFVIYSDSTSDVSYSLDNSSYTLALDKTRTNQKFEYGNALYLYEGGASTYNMIMATYGTDIVATSTISCDSTIARVTDIPTNNNQLTNGAGYITNSALSGYATEKFVTSQGYITGITSSDVTTALGYTPYNSTNPNGYITASALNGYAKTADLATVATSGSYNDLTDKPYIPSGVVVDQTYDATSQNAQSGVAIAGAGFLTGITSGDVTTALGYTPYNSSNPSGYQANKIETIKVNGTAQTITSKAVDITVPTNNNQLTNGAGYITSSALNGYAKTTDLATVATSGSYNDLTNKPTIPAAQVQADWNVTNTSSMAYIKNKPTIPSAVTESTVSGWGFTKNSGTVTSVNNVSPVNGNVTLSIPDVEAYTATEVETLWSSI